MFAAQEINGRPVAAPTTPLPYQYQAEEARAPASPRAQLVEGLSAWLLAPHEMHRQFFVQRVLVPPMGFAGVKHVGLQFLSTGDRRFLLCFDKGRTEAFDTPEAVADWLAREESRAKEAAKKGA